MLLNEIKVNWKDLTPAQKEKAREQYIYIRSCEDEITEEEAKKIYDTSDESMECMSGYYIDLEDNELICIDI